MNNLEDTNVGALRDALGKASNAKATKRLMIALAYADGVGVETLSTRYGISRATIYSWPDWPGRPPKLGASQRERLSDELAGLPAELGYDSSAWTPELAQSYIERAYNFTYLLRYVRR